MPRVALSGAIVEVARRDPALARVIELAGPITYPPRSPDGPFAALARTIVFQQLAGRAAQTILDRVVVAAGGTLTPEGLAAATDEQLRAAGLSRNKLLALRDLSDKTLAGAVDFAPAARDRDEDVISSLSSVRGPGPDRPGARAAGREVSALPLDCCPVLLGSGCPAARWC